MEFPELLVAVDTSDITTNGKLDPAREKSVIVEGGRFGFLAAHREGAALDEVGLAESHVKAKTGKKPYTNITYINASRKEQHFYIKHIQNFGKLLFLDFDFRKVSAPGSYENQEANNTLFEGSLKYESKKKKHKI